MERDRLTLLLGAPLRKFRGPRTALDRRWLRCSIAHVPSGWVDGYYDLYGLAQKTFGVNWLLLASVHRQETAFSNVFPTGEGLFAFGTVDDVLAAAEELRRNYDRHARAARALAETCFDSDKVLGRLLQEVGATA